MHFLGVETCDEEDYDDDDDGPVFFTFSGTDAPGSDGTVIITMDSGSDLYWSHVTIKASVNGAASVTDDQCASGETENCWSSTDSDADNWNVGEAITVDTSCTGVCTLLLTF